MFSGTLGNRAVVSCPVSGTRHFAKAKNLLILSHLKTNDHATNNQQSHASGKSVRWGIDASC